MIPWTLFIGAAAGSHIFAELLGRKELTFLTKPLTMLLIIGMTASAPLVWSTSYRHLILAGLAFSLAGDIFLMLRKERFVAGLFCFLLAHLIYIRAFTMQGFPLVWPVAGGVSLLAGLFFAVIRKKTGALTVPVLLYMLALGTMAVVAVSRAMVSGPGMAWAGAWGAVLFLISDGFLAVRKFRGPYRWSPLCVMATYFTAQWLIALSVFHHPDF